jgi:hypothetical protein
MCPIFVIQRKHLEISKLGACLPFPKTLFWDQESPVSALFRTEFEETVPRMCPSHNEVNPAEKKCEVRKVLFTAAEEGGR